MVTKGEAELPPADAADVRRATTPAGPPVRMGDGPVHVVSATADQMFLDIKPGDDRPHAALERRSGADQPFRRLADLRGLPQALEPQERIAGRCRREGLARRRVAGQGRPYPQQRLNDAWTLVMGGHFHDSAAGTATPRAYEFILERRCDCDEPVRRRADQRHPGGGLRAEHRRSRHRRGGLQFAEPKLPRSAMRCMTCSRLPRRPLPR